MNEKSLTLFNLLSTIYIAQWFCPWFISLWVQMNTPNFDGGVLNHNPIAKVAKILYKLQRSGKKSLNKKVNDQINNTSCSQFVSVDIFVIVSCVEYLWCELSH